MSVFNSTSSRSCTLPDDSSVAIGRISSVKTAIESPFKALSNVFWRKIHTTKRWTVNGKQTRTTRLNAFVTRPCNRPPFKRWYLAFYLSDFIHSKTIVPTTQRSIKSLLDLIQHDERLSRKSQAKHWFSQKVSIWIWISFPWAMQMRRPVSPQRECAACHGPRISQLPADLHLSPAIHRPPEKQANWTFHFVEFKTRIPSSLLLFPG